MVRDGRKEDMVLSQRPHPFISTAEAACRKLRVDYYGALSLAGILLYCMLKDT